MLHLQNEHLYLYQEILLNLSKTSKTYSYMPNKCFQKSTSVSSRRKFKLWAIHQKSSHRRKLNSFYNRLIFYGFESVLTYIIILKGNVEI